MRNLTKITILVALLLVVGASAPAFGQASLNTTTLSAAITSTQVRVITVASATGFTAGTTSLYVDRELMAIQAVSGTTITVRRGMGGTKASTHASGAAVYAGLTHYFSSTDRAGSCTAASEAVLPVINVANGRIWQCSAASRWSLGHDSAFYVPPSQCTFAPTTLTTTNTYPQIGASTVFVLNGTTNAATGTLTLTCNILLPTRVSTLKGAVLTDIHVPMGSQTTAPSAVGTATMGTITFPAAATGGTASTVTPVAVGGTITTVSPTAITSVTTAGAFLTIKSTPATAVDFSTDLTILQYTLPFTNGSLAAMTLNTPGLIVHYTAPLPATL